MTVTTTHDPSGGGNPRLLFSLGAHRASEGAWREVFVLPQGTTRIGSHPDNELCLPGLAAFHAEIRRTEGDDYVVVNLAAPGGTRLHGRPVDCAELHSGARLELGEWVVSYARAESADHGRPNGGRQGGELSAGRRVGA
ncbi:MAG: FHA domain-containing protein [Actinomycetota bacterium]|nr:FHA domain-containing protein [Actinomycetota bacterium]